MTVGNQKAQRMKSLKRYFQARNKELVEFIENNLSVDGFTSATEGVLGIEIAVEEEATNNDITMYLRGGKKLSRLRISVDVAKSDNIILEEVPSSELEGICTKLGIPVGVPQLDAYINGLIAASFMPNEEDDSAGCTFVLIQNFVVRS